MPILVGTIVYVAAKNLAPKSAGSRASTVVRLAASLACALVAGKISASFVFLKILDHYPNRDSFAPALIAGLPALIAFTAAAGSAGALVNFVLSKILKENS